MQHNPPESSEGLFLAKFPCYVPVSPPFQFDTRTKQILIDGSNNYFVKHSGNTIAVLAFTDLFDAKDFLYQKDLCGFAMLIEVERPEDLVRLVDGLMKHRGVLPEHAPDVLFDASKNHPGWPIPYSSLSDTPDH